MPRRAICTFQQDLVVCVVIYLHYYYYSSIMQIPKKIDCTCTEPIQKWHQRSKNRSIPTMSLQKIKPKQLVFIWNIIRLIFFQQIFKIHISKEMFPRSSKKRWSKKWDVPKKIKIQWIWWRYHKYKPWKNSANT